METVIQEDTEPARKMMSAVVEMDRICSDHFHYIVLPQYTIPIKPISVMHRSMQFLFKIDIGIHYYYRPLSHCI